MKKLLSILFVLLAINSLQAKPVISKVNSKMTFAAICGRWYEVIEEGRVVGRERVCVSIKHGRYVDTQTFQ